MTFTALYYKLVFCKTFENEIQHCNFFQQAFFVKMTCKISKAEPYLAFGGQLNTRHHYMYYSKFLLRSKVKSKKVLSFLQKTQYINKYPLHGVQFFFKSNFTKIPRISGSTTKILWDDFLII